MFQIQSQLQVQSEETGMVYSSLHPQLLTHKYEDGENRHQNPSLIGCTNDKICEAIIRTNVKDGTIAESLGMVDFLEKHKVWNTIHASVNTIHASVNTIHASVNTIHASVNSVNVQSDEKILIMMKKVQILLSW